MKSKNHRRKSNLKRIVSKKIVISLFLCAMLSNSYGQITAYFSRCAFNTPDNKPYVETYISILGNSVAFKKNAKGKYQGMVEVGVLFAQNGQIKASKKYNLLSPEQNDTLTRPPFIDQQRFQLDTGMYDFELMIADKNISGKTFSMKDKVHVGFSAEKVNISDIESLVSFTKAEKQGPLTKNGFDLVPYTSDFFPENVKNLSFYAEVYNTNRILGENEKFLLSYYIESFEKKAALPKYSVFKKETTSPVNILLSEFNIADLPSGNYNLIVEVKNKNNEVVAQRTMFFQRKNPTMIAEITPNDLSIINIENTFASRITGKDTLKDILRSLRPISSIAERRFLDNQLKLANEKLMQQFLYNFWLSRNHLAPEDEWKKYDQNVQAVNRKFGIFARKGYDTDRGRVYLQYGSPDSREDAPHEPNAYPYEIWSYNRLEDKSNLNPPQTNKQFIFYEANIASNDYLLIHSNALSEIHDDNWEVKLHNRHDHNTNDYERNIAPDHFGGHADEDFKNPH
jgi:GWxTD domain-containing protein